MSPDEEFRQFVQARAAPLHRAAYLLCGDWHLADDLVQETLTKAFRHWRRVQRADSPDAYVRRILINEANRLWKRNRRNPSPSAVNGPEAGVADGSDRLAERAALLQALMALPARQRAVVVLRYLEGMSERETAFALDCSEGTVKSQSSRALHSLKDIIQREEMQQ